MIRNFDASFLACYLELIRLSFNYKFLKFGKGLHADVIRKGLHSTVVDPVSSEVESS